MNEQRKALWIKSSVLGGELDARECEVLGALMEERSLADGELLVTEGDVDDSLFLLAEGDLAVSNTIDGAEVAVYLMSPGECAGTRAFVDRTPRKATLRAVGEVTVLVLKPDRFETLLDSEPRLVYKVMRALFRATHNNLMRMDQENAELTKYITKTGGRY